MERAHKAYESHNETMIDISKDVHKMTPPQLPLEEQFRTWKTIRLLLGDCFESKKMN